LLQGHFKETKQEVKKDGAARDLLLAFSSK
jgi:hypothetical protein